MELYVTLFQTQKTAQYLAIGVAIKTEGECYARTRHVT